MTTAPAPGFHAPLADGEELREVVYRGDKPVRLDRALAACLGVSRRRAMELVERDRVRVEGRRAPKGADVPPGSRLVVRMPPPESPAPQPSLPLAILYADAAVVVADKPAGMPSHPLEPGELGTVANVLVARFPDLAAAGGPPREAGLVHRLDVDTSGCLLAARTSAARENLRAQFDSHNVEKIYLALVVGELRDEGEVSAPIAHDPDDPRRVRVATDPDWASEHRARPAQSFYAPVEWVGGPPAYTLVRVRIPTGVLHQIRAHLAHVGHPVAGDALYGGPRVPGLKRHFLHAASIAFDHPTTGERVCFESPLPPDLRDALARLR